MSVVINPAEGRGYIGQHSVDIRLVGDSGAIQVNGDKGPCLRPVSFMERSRLVGYASVASQPSKAMAKLIYEASLLDKKSARSDIEPELITILALALAGADEANMPSFTESIILISQRNSWNPEQLGQCNAADIDVIAKQLADDHDEGWVKLAFGNSDANDLIKIQTQLADNLLARLKPNKSLNKGPANSATGLQPAEIKNSKCQFKSIQTQDHRSGKANDVDVAPSLSHASFSLMDSELEASICNGVKSWSNIIVRNSATPILKPASLEIPFQEPSNSDKNVDYGIDKAQLKGALSSGDSGARASSGSTVFKSPAEQRSGHSIAPRPASNPAVTTTQLSQFDAIEPQVLIDDAVSENVAISVEEIGQTMPTAAQLLPPIFTDRSQGSIAGTANGIDFQPGQRQLAQRSIKSEPQHATHAVDFHDVFDELAFMLHFEGDLRGIDR